MRGGTTIFDIYHLIIFISIHPPHAGRDRCNFPAHLRNRYFNPPSPCGEGQHGSNPKSSARAFQSTLPMRGGTCPTYQYYQNKQISIHPPHAGRDRRPDAGGGAAEHFNPPSPCGEGPCPIPIRWILLDFNPPSPCGEGPARATACRVDTRFQSTLPMRGGTLIASSVRNKDLFQSTLPMRGGTCSFLWYIFDPIFQSTLPMRGGTISVAAHIVLLSISIHPPHAGRDPGHRK